ncbi:restriction endonuclease subunit S, partial [Thalassolituus oleivorans]|uniref:restriction endonuclease subunit S n=1 Tax=Thalassolituus oleivorans TaxID=187493 RepID=UPI0023EFEAC2
MSNKHAIKEAPASYQSTPVPSANRELQNFIAGNPLTDNLNLWISATKAKSTSGRGSNKKIELVGIKKLRELILELAVRGKLVPQNPEDEPASELLKKIDAEKAKLVKEGKIKKQKPLPEITDEEKPFELPEGWEWARVGELGTTSTGKTPSTAKPEFFNGQVPFIGPGQISHTGQILKPDKYLTEAGSIYSSEAIKGDIISVCIGGSIGKSAIVKNRITFNQQINSISPIKIDGTYLYHAISTDLFINMILENSSGSATPIINRSKWDNLLVPVSPLAEQQRIIAKVDELMALCDQLEQHSEHQLDAHKQLVETLLATLVESKNADDLATNWQRLAEHFDTLFSGALTSTAGIGNGGGEWAIDRLKDTILQLAVMGKLVPQNPDDEPASELLKKIETEKAKMVKEGKIKKQKPLPEITDQEKPFELPDGWEWGRVGELGTTSTGKTPSTAKPEFFNGQVPFIGPGQISQTGQILKPDKYLTEAGSIYSSEAIKGDIISVCIGGSIGKSAIVKNRITFNQQINSISPIKID